MKNTRNITTKTLTLGTPETITIPRNYAHRELILRLSGTVDFNQGNAAPTQLSQGCSNLLSNIRIRRDGKDTVYSLGGLLTFELNKLLYGTPPNVTLVGTATAVGQAAKVTLRIPFENVNGIKPFDTLLKGAGLSSLDLIVDTQAAINMFYYVGSSASATWRRPRRGR